VDKVRIGFFSFTEITDPAEHHSYNAWHQLDHMPEQYPLRGVVYGQRWVSTPACRRARAVDERALSPVHYVTLYLMGEPVHATLREFRALGDTLRSLGRFHAHRRARLSGPFEVTGTRATARVLVSPQAVPYRPNRGVYIVVRDRNTDAHARRPGTDGDAGDEDPGSAGALDERVAQSLLAADGVAGAWTFGTHRRFDRHGWRPGDRSVTVCYLDEDPLSVAGDLGRRVLAVTDDAGAGAGVVFAGPLETITPWRWDWFDGTA
jgi:hypothetical protein